MASEDTHFAETRRIPRFSGTLADVLDRVTYRRARLHDLSDPIYRLRYDAYRREGFIPPNAEQVLTDPFDSDENAYGYGVFIDDEIVSSVRVHHVTPEIRTCGSITLWPEILNEILDRGESFIDPTRFTADHEASLAYPALPFLTLRLVTMAAEYFNTRYCLHSVRPEHGAYYKRMFGSQKWGEEKFYPGLHFPMVLYVAHIEDVREAVKTRFPVFMSTRAEREALFGGSGDEVYERQIVPSALEAYRQRLRQEEISAA